MDFDDARYIRQLTGNLEFAPVLRNCFGERLPLAKDFQYDRQATGDPTSPIDAGAQIVVESFDELEFGTQKHGAPYPANLVNDGIGRLADERLRVGEDFSNLFRNRQVLGFSSQ